MLVVLASRSPARLATLRAAGIEPAVVVSGFDEDSIVESDPVTLVAALARAKAEAVAAMLAGVAAEQPPSPDVIPAQAGTSPEDVIPAQAGISPEASQTPAFAGVTIGRALDQRDPSSRLVIGCDSVLAFDGAIHGKPADATEAAARWRLMRGRSGVLHTGHHVIHGDSARTAVASTTVHFADLSDAEIDAYVATGEPVEVAGAFTIDGLGGAYVTAIAGDHHAVVGISLPMLRTMLLELGISWHTLWRNP